MDHGRTHGRRIRIVGLSRVVVLLTAGLFAFPAQSCEAGPLLDWLFGKKRQQRTALYPTTAAAAATGATPQGCCGAGYCEQTVLKYQPQVAYRTVWQPVPVTTYKRTVSYNPTTGLPITCTRPCTSYTYQARRVPYTTYRPYYTTEAVTVPGNCPTSAAAATAPVQAYATAAPTASPSCGCSSGAGSAGLNVPYYTTPSQTSAPTGANPPGATPWTRVDPGTGTVPYTQSPTPAGTGDPADQRPGIAPQIEPDIGNRDRYRPSTSNRTTAAGDNTTAQIDRYYRRSSRLGRIEPVESPSRTRLESNSLSRVRGFDSLNAPTNQTPPASSLNRLDGSSSRSNTVRPLPNLDMSPRGKLETPRLLNDTQDRTASYIQPIPTRWNANRISWPERRVSYQAPIRNRDHDGGRLYNTSRTRRVESQRASALEQGIPQTTEYRRVNREPATTRAGTRPRPTETRASQSRTDRNRSAQTPLYRFDSESNQGRPYTGDGWRSLNNN